MQPVALFPPGRKSADFAAPVLNAALHAARAQWPVALVSMPFVFFERPSLQLGLLQAIGAAHGFPVQAFHLNMDFARQIGPVLYDALCQHRGRLLGEWLFSAEAFGDRAPDPDDRFLQTFASEMTALLAGVQEPAERLQALRHVEIPRYLDHLVEAIPWDRFRVVGFTSTFQQNAASFALAARIKRRFPDICLLFGGANFEGEMGLELVRTVDCIDYAVIGEGDEAFPEFLIALQEGRDPTTVPGVVGKRNGAVTPLRPRPPFKALDALPTPIYDDFFERGSALGLLDGGRRREVDIPFESARGCWWGQKHHCTFCGLNGATLGFRAKSPQRVVDELGELTRRYGSFQFEAVDNILDLSYLKEFFTRLVAAGADYKFFYEVKSNLTREKMKILRDGGVRRIQPGIEAVNTRILRLMNKGVTAIQNVNTLRWALYYNINVSWNLLWGFPGESEADYEQQLALLRQLIHLQPPLAASRIWMERFSPIFTDRATFPARAFRPEASYTFVYPAGIDLERLAYFFDYELENTLAPPVAVWEETSRQVRRWREAWGVRPRPALTFWAAPGLVQIEDGRDPSAPANHTFDGPAATLYQACSDRPRSAADLQQELGLAWNEHEVGAALARFTEQGLMMQDGNLFLALALPATRGR